MQSPLAHNGIFSIGPEVSQRDIEDLGNNPETSVIQFSSALTPSVYDMLEEIIFSKRPEILLRIYDSHVNEVDLEFLKQLPSIKRLSIDCVRDVKSIKPISNLKKLTALRIGIFDFHSLHWLNDVPDTLKELHLYQMHSKNISLDVIRRFQDIEYLYIEGQSKGIEAVQYLKKLEKVALRSISTKTLNYLSELPNLWSVDIKLGGIRNFDALTTLPNLKYLELWQVRKLSDLFFISSLAPLQNLFLQSLPNVEKLPNLAQLKSLRRISLWNMKGLKDFSACRHAPSLTEFSYVDARGKNPRDLQPVLDNPSVTAVRCGFGSEKKNIEFENLAKKAGKEKYEWSAFEYV
ncbi:MAG: hypothetical protein SFY70_09540 [Bacteroidia bacterium]|nr:hypothetical protein [Bacteroidia bacterium]